MKTKAIIFLLFFIITTSYSQSSLFEIDNTRYPFSYRGSYWAFLQFDGYSKPAKALFLHDMSRTGEMELFKFELLKNETPVEANIIQTPVNLHMKSADGNANICFQNADIVRVKSENAGMKLSYLKQVNIIPINKNQFRIFINSNRLIFCLIKGSFKITQQDLENTDKHHNPVINPKNLIITILPDEKGILEFAFERYVSEYAPRTYDIKFEDIISTRKDEFNKFYKPISDKAGNTKEVLCAAYLDWASIVKPLGHFKREAMVMSKTWMNGVWSWDHCFNAIAMSFAHPEIAWDQLMLMFDNQDELGDLPDAIYVNDLQWAHLKLPMHGWTLMKMMKNSPDFFTTYRLNEIYPKLEKWTNFWFNYRDDDGNGIVQVNHGNDDFDWLPVYDAGFPMEDPQVNMMLVFQMDALSDVATKLGKISESKIWKQRSDELLSKIIKRFWNGEKFLYKVSGSENYTKETISILQYTPMLLGKKLPDDIRKKLVESFVKSELMTKNGVLTESQKSPLFNADTYTRGSIWSPLNYFIIEGLKECSETKLADQLTIDFKDVLKRSGFSERLNPYTGEPWSDPSYTWTSSIFLILNY